MILRTVSSKYLAVVIFCAFLVSCASQKIYRLYTGKKKPVEQVALLELLPPELMVSEVFPPPKEIKREGNSITNAFSFNYFAPAIWVVSIDGDSIQRFIGERRELHHIDKYTILPGKHKIGMMYKGIIGGIVEVKQSAQGAGTWFSSGVSRPFDISQDFKTPLMLEFETEAGKTYYVETAVKLNACVVIIKSNETTVAENVTTDLELDGDEALIFMMKQNMKK